MKRYFITMYTKGQLLRRASMYKEFFSFEKTSKKQEEIVSVDWEGIKKYAQFKHDEEMDIKGYSTGSAKSAIHFVESILGIANNSPYKFRSLLKEIKKDDCSIDYCSMPTSYITKESEKAYYIQELDAWIPKSQTIIKDDILNIKRWVIANI